MAATILAIAVAAIFMPFTCGIQSQSIECRQTLAVSLAEELMEEALRLPFEEPDDGDDLPEPVSKFGPDGSERFRSSFTAIDDFHGYQEQPGQICDSAGRPYDDDAMAGMSRSVSVSYVYVSGQDTSESPTFMKIVVQVSHDGQEIVKITRLVHWVQ